MFGFGKKKRKLQVNVPQNGWIMEPWSNTTGRIEVEIPGAEPYQGTHLQVSLVGRNYAFDGSKKVFEVGKIIYVAVEGVDVLDIEDIEVSPGITRPGQTVMKGRADMDDFEIELV